jgi:hypothetical protein
MTTSSPLNLFTHAIWGELTFQQVDGNWTQIQGNFNQLRTDFIAQVPPNNLTATTNPLVTDDFSLGYRELSRWYNTVTEKLWICIDPTTGQALWIESDFNSLGFGSAAIADLGTNPDNVPQVSDLGGAAFADIGAGSGDVLNKTSADALYLPVATTLASLGAGNAVGFNEASAADIWSGTASRTVSAESVENALAFVTLTDAATIAVDLETGINFVVTLTANRVLGNPSNGVPGKTYTVLVKGNDGTNRTLTFGANYKGDIPVINNVTSTNWFLMTIFCIASDHYTVAAQDAL